MADEAGVDPDAMWKPGYVAPGDRGGGDGPNAEVAAPEWFADYRQRQLRAADHPSDPEPDGDSRPPSGSPGTDRLATGTGGEPPHDLGAGPRHRAARGWLVAVITLGVVVVGGVAWQATRDDTAARSRRLASIPERAVPAWTAELDTGHVTNIIGTRSTIVVLELVTNDLVGLTAESGQERWRVNVAPSRSIARLDEVDGAAIVLVEESGGNRSVAGYALESGERLWRHTGLDPASVVAFQGILYRLPAGITRDGTLPGLERLDPRSGEPLNALTAELSSVGWAHAATVRDDVVEVFDLQTLERVGGPLAVGDVVAASAYRDRVVGLGRDAMLRLYGATGDQLASLQITADQTAQFDVTESSEPVLLVVADGEIVGYSLSGDQIAHLWRTGPVQVNEITAVGDRTYAVVHPVVAAGPNGGPVRVVDAATGVAVAEPRGGSWVLLGQDGFVVEISDDEGVRQAIQAYGYDGAQRWRFDLARDQQGVFLVDGAVVLVASDTAAQTSTLTYLT